MPTDAEIAARLKAILQSDEFRPRLGDQLWNWLRGPFRFLQDFFSSLGYPVYWVAVSVAILILAVIVSRWLRAYREARGLAEKRASQRHHDQSAPLSVEGLLRRARSLADAGGLRDASRTLQ